MLTTYNRNRPLVLPLMSHRTLYYHVLHIMALLSVFSLKFTDLCSLCSAVIGLALVTLNHWDSGQICFLYNIGRTYMDHHIRCKLIVRTDPKPTGKEEQNSNRNWSLM